MKNILFIFFLLLANSCSLRTNELVEGKEQFKEASVKEIRFLNQKFLDDSDNDAPSSLVSEVSVSSSLVKRSFEQILLFSANEYKFVWYAPNYLQILSTLIGNDNSWLFCDYLVKSCFNDFSQSNDFSFLEAFLRIEGFNVAGLFLGVATNFDPSKEFKFTQGPQAQYILTYQQGDLNFEFLLKGKNTNEITVEKLFIGKANKRLVEIFYNYDHEPKQSTIPSQIKIFLVEENIDFEFNLRKFAEKSLKIQENTFSQITPPGFQSK